MNNKFCKTCKKIYAVYNESKYCEFCGTKLEEITNINNITLKEEGEP